MKNLLLIIALVNLAILGTSQDTLFKKVGDPIICKVTEIGEDEVKYKMLDNADGPTYSIAAAKLKYIRLKNGTEHRFTESEMLATGADSKTLNKKNAIKIAPFSPLFGTITLGYERVQKFGLHWEGEVGIIGMGSTDNFNKNQKGAWFYGGPKMLLRNETYTKGERYYHFLHGTYFRPELGFEYQTGRERVFTSNMDRIDANYTLVHLGLMLNIGKQWVIADIMTLDIWLGLGMASNNLNYDKKEIRTNYDLFEGIRSRAVESSMGNNGEIGFSGQAGVKLGVIF